jgi:UDP-N-acetylmuramate dehydrogenase
MTIKDFQKDVSMAEQINFKLGGKAKYFFVAKTKEEIIEAVKLAKKENLSFYVLGGGSNVLAADEGYDGLVIKIQNSKYEVLNTEITIEAGAILSDIVELAEQNLLSGLEWAAGIPGEVGGAVYGNAQAFGENMAGIVEQVEVFDCSSLETKKYGREDFDYSEKTSIFKKNKNLIILSVILKLKKGDQKEIKEKMKEHFDLRKEKHPLNYPSAGSMFVNNPSVPPSSYLIEKAGLKGFRVGNAQISEKHAGFIINLGGATCKDVMVLVGEIKRKVKDEFGITLEQEVQIIK